MWAHMEKFPTIICLHTPLSGFWLAEKGPMTGGGVVMETTWWGWKWRHPNRKSRGLGWETADQVEKGIAGPGDRKSRDLGWETADRVEKGSRAQATGSQVV